MNKQREVIYTWRNEVIDTEDPRSEIFEVIDEAVPNKVKEYLDGEEPNYAGLINWVNVTFPLGLNKERAQFETRSVDENAKFLIEKIKDAYQRKSNHEEPTAVKSLERYIILNAIDRLWQEHLYAMDALREGVYLRGYAQKDPLVEYKTEAYDMFVELMANIKNEVLHNLFRSTTNLARVRRFPRQSAAILTSRRCADRAGSRMLRCAPSAAAGDGNRNATEENGEAKCRSICQFGDRCLKLAGTSPALAVAAKNTRIAAAAPPNSNSGFRN